MPDHPRANNKGWVYEHYVNAEKNIGRYLRKGEAVHHVDGNKWNNDPSNLIVFATWGDHSSCHGGAQIYKDEEGIWHAIKIGGHKYCGNGKSIAIRDIPSICKYCGRKFLGIKGQRNKYCSIECSGLDKRLFDPPIEELVETLRKENGNFSRVGTIYNVTDNAIRRRLKKHGMPYRSRDYRSKDEW